MKGEKGRGRRREEEGGGKREGGGGRREKEWWLEGWVGWYQTLLTSG